MLPRSGLKSILHGGFDNVGSPHVAGATPLAEPVGHFLLGRRAPTGSGLQLDVAAHDPQAHHGEPPKARTVELPHLYRLVSPEESPQGPGHVARVGRHKFRVALESHRSEMKSCFAGVPFVQPVMW